MTFPGLLMLNSPRAYPLKLAVFRCLLKSSKLGITATVKARAMIIDSKTGSLRIIEDVGMGVGNVVGEGKGKNGSVLTK